MKIIVKTELNIDDNDPYYINGIVTAEKDSDLFENVSFLLDEIKRQYKTSIEKKYNEDS